ncbi:MAG: Kdo hydroxylase family protein [Gammaproteobacteria bacterium]|nr:Kdo hydroxylase family protein [Gammaproteobacteria bacterium]MDH5274849.1 Kdo hydroxylase family protein [Gammaproteobacteria bacterium]
MLETFDSARLAAAGPRTLSDVLEQGRIVYLPRCPVALPDEADLAVLRDQLAGVITRKNVSYHPEADSVRGLDPKSPLYPVTYRALTGLRQNVTDWARRTMPDLLRNADIGTCSFRPIEEAGRAIDAHKASELIHVDAGAYGATNGDRILRFLVNVHPTRDRVWASKGSFNSVFARHAERAGFTGPKGRIGRLDKNALDQLLTALLKGVSAVVPLAKVLDTSPYDRAMKRFHDYLKDTPEFQSDVQHHVEMRFAPYSAWMVFADGVSHGCLSGQHCFIWTALTPLANAHYPELAPINVLRAAA